MEKHIEKVYTDKAINLLKICIALSIFSLLTYLVGIFLYKAFDFGFIFEIISFAFIILAYLGISKANFQSSKRYIIIAMIPIGWLLIYDFINLLVNLKEVLIEVFGYYTSLDQYFYYLEPYLFDITLVGLIILLYKCYSSLSIADGSQKTNDFYDKL